MSLCVKSVELAHVFDSMEKCQSFCDIWVLNRFIESGYPIEIEGKIYLVIGEDNGEKVFLKNGRKEN